MAEAHQRQATFCNAKKPSYQKAIDLAIYFQKVNKSVPCSFCYAGYWDESNNGNFSIEWPNRFVLDWLIFLSAQSRVKQKGMSKIYEVSDGV